MRIYLFVVVNDIVKSKDVFYKIIIDISLYLRELFIIKSKIVITISNIVY